MAEDLKELLIFVQIGARADLKVIALDNIKGLTVTAEGVEAIIAVPQLLVSLISLLHDNNATISETSALCLQNISADVKAAGVLISLDVEKHCPPLQRVPQNVVETCLKFIFDKDSALADFCCKILSNLSRHPPLVETVVDMVEASPHGFDDIINVFTKNSYNKTGCNLHYLGPVFSNLSQSRQVRVHILDRNRSVIQRLLPFTKYKESLERRGGVVGTLRNCCFESDFHEWLLSSDVDILPSLLLPLAGNEAFDDDDNDKLPVDLQYLEPDKTREEDPDIRVMLLEALTQLCTLRQNRTFIRDKNTYVILRELHKWETDRKALLACENLISILIRYESEIEVDDLREVDVPEEQQIIFTEEDSRFLKDE